MKELSAEFYVSSELQPVVMEEVISRRLRDTFCVLHNSSLVRMLDVSNRCAVFTFQENVVNTGNIFESLGQLN